MRVIEEVKKGNLTAVLCCIDFKKAFDSIHQGMMVKILHAYGIPPTYSKQVRPCTQESNKRARAVSWLHANTQEIETIPNSGHRRP